MKTNLLCSVIIFVMGVVGAYSQTWDNTQFKKWPSDCKEVQINATSDQSIQKAFFFKAQDSIPRPLIVSLHTWSGDYLQEDPLVNEIILQNFHYIHPDFRGPNNQPEAGGSEKVITDIQDAIQFVIQNANVDLSEIHIIGTSGGGYATLLCYSRLKLPIKSFSAWVPISDLESWYDESIGRKQKYADDVLKLTGSENGKLNKVEARKRSPIHDSIPIMRLNESSLHIYTGIHDGYTGAVPITQSISMYNHVVRQKTGCKPDHLVSDSEIIYLLSKRNGYSTEIGNIGNRRIHLSKNYQNIHLTLFEGGHEQLSEVALSLIPIYEKQSLPPLSILTIGDSNATFDFGWSARLKVKNPYGNTQNYAIAGNTIGFDNNNLKALNTLRNIDSLVTFSHSANAFKAYNYILINLGTNDCKSCYKDRWSEMESHFTKLIEHLKYSVIYQKGVTQIIVITPSPLNTALVDPKYSGSEKCIQKWNGKLEKLAKKQDFIYLNSYKMLLELPYFTTSDGVHLTPREQEELAKFITNKIWQNEKNE